MRLCESLGWVQSVPNHKNTRHAKTRPKTLLLACAPTCTAHSPQVLHLDVDAFVATLGAAGGFAELRRPRTYEEPKPCC